ncbi:hypothetical protein JYQ62_02050 [Nostoc sp. UHCC 0702]|nr:hypothetical protein JYQ62_02050 [Nostoc sp. UHCC 0702]
MQIVLSGFNIDDTINSHWQASQLKIETIQRDREEAESSAVNGLMLQFQRELDTYLDSNIQKSLDLKVIPPTQINALSVYAVFKFSDNEFLLKRNTDNWEICFNGSTLVCPPDLLQKTVLFELGKIKHCK